MNILNLSFIASSVLFFSSCTSKSMKSEYPASFSITGPYLIDTTFLKYNDCSMFYYQMKINKIQNSLYIRTLLGTEFYDPERINYIKVISKDSTDVTSTIRDFITEDFRLLNQDSSYIFNFRVCMYSDDIDSLGLEFCYFEQEDFSSERYIYLKIPVSSAASRF